MTSYLAYGAIGLGLALAILAYRLLAKEQERDAPPRSPLLNATYVFMAFALVLATGGFVGEYLKSDAAKIGDIRTELTETSRQLAELQAKHAEMKQGLNSSRLLMDSLLDIKEGKVARLKQLNPKAPEYAPLVNEIQADLERMDQSFRTALGF